MLAILHVVVLRCVRLLCGSSAHRLSTIRNADNIYVFENSGDGGHIVESGTYDELIAQEGKFAKLAEIFADK